MAKSVWICRTEELFISLGAVLIHDGLRNPGQFEFPPDKVGFFTRYYRCRMDWRFINTWAKFIYDKRSGHVDFELTFKDPRTGRKEIEKRRMSLSHNSETQEVFKSAEVGR